MNHVTARTSLALAAVLALLPLGPALAHTGVGSVSGLASGFMHPISGLDHLVAMLAVGLWSAQLGGRALWVLPITFPLVMAVGGLIGMGGAELPFTEIMIALSGLGLGLAVALEAKPPLWIAALLTGIFAIFHGYAHGKELPEAADPILYGAGFLAATLLLHLCGIALGILTRSPAGAWAIRAGGVAIGCAGAFFLLGAMEIGT